MVKVCVAGKFDPLLRGHLDHIKKAKALGDYLVVITHPDDVVVKARLREGKKGICVIPLADRIAVLESLKWVDEVVVSVDGNGECAETLRLIRPQIFAKGGDRTDDSRMPSGELTVCKEIGCEVRYGIGELLTSSSETIQKNLK